MTDFNIVDGCSCRSPRIIHAEDVLKTREFRSALRVILELAERSDAHPEVQIAEVARKALASDQRTTPSEDR